MTLTFVLTPRNFASPRLCEYRSLPQTLRAYVPLFMGRDTPKDGWQEWGEEIPVEDRPIEGEVAASNDILEIKEKPKSGKK